MKAQDKERLETIADRVVAAIRSNPNKKIRYEKIEENLMDTKISKAKDFKVQKLDEKQATEDVFKIIRERKCSNSN